MRLLADESLDARVVRALREAGNDVRSIAEDSPGSDDEDVALLSKSEKRILITEDRDFGRLVYALLQGAPGVIYLRYPATARAELAGRIANLVEDQADRLIGAFVVVQPGRIRISRLPER
jgi:predicted nuclease of predicted toxin-antitoxin system